MLIMVGLAIVAGLAYYLYKRNQAAAVSPTSASPATDTLPGDQGGLAGAGVNPGGASTGTTGTNGTTTNNYYYYYGGTQGSGSGPPAPLQYPAGLAPQQPTAVTQSVADNLAASGIQSSNDNLLGGVDFSNVTPGGTSGQGVGTIGTDQNGNVVGYTGDNQFTTITDENGQQDTVGMVHLGLHFPGVPGAAASLANVQQGTGDTTTQLGSLAGSGVSAPAAPFMAPTGLHASENGATVAAGLNTASALQRAQRQAA
jgi:hypothetical protein